MEWIDIIITLPHEHAGAAQDIAAGISSRGFYMEDYADLEEQVQAIAHMDLIEQELRDKPRDEVKLHLYFAPEENAAEIAQTLHSRLLSANLPYRLETAGVQQEDWESAWKQYYHPIEIGSRLAVAPSWEPYEGARTTLRLDPGMAFGTGTHETTFLCLEILDKEIHGGEKVLDIGTGSGILAIAALLLGAEKALGIDIDPIAVRTAKENARRNAVEDRLDVQTGDLAQKAGGRYDIITANIVANAILQLAPAIPPLLAGDGLFIASGIIIEREAEVLAGLQKAGLCLAGAKHKNGWAALVMKKA